MSNTPEQPAQKTASQRIEDLEKGLMSMYQAFNTVAQDLSVAKEAIKLLGNKVSSIMTVAQSGDPLTEENVSKAMVANNVEELKEKVASLVTQGVLVTQEETAADSFVVGRELDDQGTVVNPRLQFALAALQPPVQSKIAGHKVGDVVTIEEGKLKFEVLEVYSIQTPKAPETEAPQAETPTAAPVMDSAPEAPEADTSAPTA